MKGENGVPMLVMTSEIWEWQGKIQVTCQQMQENLSEKTVQSLLNVNKLKSLLLKLINGKDLCLYHFGKR